MEKVVEILQGKRKEGSYHYGYVDGEENLEVLFEKFRQGQAFTSQLKEVDLEKVMVAPILVLQDPSSV